MLFLIIIFLFRSDQEQIAVSNRSDLGKKEEFLPKQGVLSTKLKKYVLKKYAENFQESLSSRNLEARVKSFFYFLILA